MNTTRQLRQVTNKFPLPILIKLILLVCIVNLLLDFFTSSQGTCKRPAIRAIKLVSTHDKPVSPGQLFHLHKSSRVAHFIINPHRCSKQYNSSVDRVAAYQLEKSVETGIITQGSSVGLKQKRNRMRHTSHSKPSDPHDLDDIFLVIFVHSAPRHFEHRKTIRSTWGKEDNFNYFTGINHKKMRLVFILGLSDNDIVNHLVAEEANIYKDIVVGNFIDTYRNLTYKHLTGLSWVTYHCNTAPFVLKTDDDVFLDIIDLTFQLKSLQVHQVHVNNLLACSIILKSEPVRKVSKWQVSFEEYEDDYYPVYCSGWSILMSQDVAEKLLLTSYGQPFFWVDDVHVTGTLASHLGLKHQYLPGGALTDRSMHEGMDSWLNDPKLVLPPAFENEIDAQRIKNIWSKVVQYYKRAR